MSKDKDYLEKIEVHRQEVELEEVRRRRTRTSRKQNNAPKSPLMKILVVIFIFIPLSLLGYVWFLYEPEVGPVTTEQDNTIVHIEKNNTPSSPSDVTDEEDESETDHNEEEQNASSGSLDDVEVSDVDQQAIDKATQEAEEQLKAQQKEENKVTGQSTNTSNARKHVVQENDTLYSLARKYYNDPTKVEAIKKANNLSSDSISVGSELILP